jgi:hypothetical protein
MLNLRKHARLAVPVAAAFVAAAAVGGPALASTASSATKAHPAATTRGKTGKTGPRGHTGPRSLQGPQGPAGTNGTNGANGAAGTTGTAAGGGAEATILYAANPPAAPTSPNAPTPPAAVPTVIYSGHGLAFAATCSANGPVLTLQAGAGDAIKVNDTAVSPTPSVTTALNDYSKDLTTAAGDTNDVLFASTDGSVVQLHFVTSSTQTGARCFIYGTRIGG